MMVPAPPTSQVSVSEVPQRALRLLPCGSGFSQYHPGRRALEDEGADELLAPVLEEELTWAPLDDDVRTPLDEAPLEAGGPLDPPASAAGGASVPPSGT
jgi:hypothetical protein